MEEGLKKFEIVNRLAAKHRLHSYLEVCTPSTGFTFDQIQSDLFNRIDRFVYRCPPTENDGLTYTFRTEGENSSEILDAIYVSSGRQPIYDVIFLDPWHEYSISTRDLAACWKLLKEGGYLVVHDCNPPDEQLASPAHRWGGWCGETYRAYIDFVLFRSDLTFQTVDTDYGCGVLQKVEPQNSIRPPASLLVLWLHWLALSESPGSKYEFFSMHRIQLLNLISSKNFLDSLS